jgi:NTE family protein
VTRPRIGLALGSGAARGWSHIGAIEALAEAGIVPDVICGSSIGALVGAAHVAGRLPALKQWAEAATWREIVKLLDLRFTPGGLIDGVLIVRFLRELGIAAPIESYGARYAAVATDLASGREVWLQQGPIEDAVRASIALPGIISPSFMQDSWLVDGGLVNPVPVSTCRALGADIVIAVNLNHDMIGRRIGTDADIASLTQPSDAMLARWLGSLPEPVRKQASQIAPRLLRSGPRMPNYFDVLANSIYIMQDQITRSRLAGEPPHVLLQPRLRTIGLMEFNRAREAIALGRAAVEEALPSLRSATAGRDAGDVTPA